MPNRVRLLTVPDYGRAELLRWSRGQGTPARMAEWVRIVMLAASGVTDPLLDAKVRDVMGLYLNPPENAVVVCANEKYRLVRIEKIGPRTSTPGRVRRWRGRTGPYSPRSR